MAGMIDRDDVGALIPEDVANEIIKNLPKQSAALSLFRSVRMSRKQQRMPALAALPTASFINGDTGQKPLTEMKWKNKFLNAEPLAAIVAVPEDVIDDSDFDIWGEVRPALEEAIGRAIDGAVFFGINKPASWPTAIAPAAVAVSHTVTRGTATQATGGIAEDVNQLMAKVEADGFDPNGFVADRAYKSRLRSARDTTGQKLLDIGTDGSSINGSTVMYTMAGLWPTGSGATELITGDFTEGILATRADLTWKVLTEATLYNPDGSVAFALAQQDMVALRVVMRVAFEVSNALNYSQLDDNLRFPFAVMQAP